MSYKLTASAAPYYDDFNADKNFLRVLFNPGKAVQARELTQACTILQNQVATFGTHIFKDGASVLNAKIVLDNEKPYIELNDLLTDDATNIVIDDTWIVPGVELWTSNNTVDGIKNNATVLATVDRYDETAVPKIVYLNYSYGEFNPGDEIVIPNVIATTHRAIVSTNGTGYGTVAHVNDGIVYINGQFIIIKDQTVLVEPKNANSVHKIGYKLIETVVTSSEDSTLNDPANGSYNYNAPGADRYNVELILFSYEETNFADIETDGNFISIIETTQYGVSKTQKLVEYSAILDTLAKRTFDESGSYTIDAFVPRIINHATDDNKLSIVLDPGKAYVLGYEIETVAPTTIDIDKARTEVFKNSANIITEFGPYVDIDYNTASNVSGYFDVSIKEELYLKSGSTGNGDTLGTVRVLSVLRSTDGHLHVYLSDMDKYESIFSSVRSIAAKADVTRYMTVDLVNGAPILNGNTKKALLFDTYSTDLSRYDSAENIYSVTRTVSQVSSGGSVTINQSNTFEVFNSEPVVYITDNNNNIISGYVQDIGDGSSLTITSLPAGTMTVTYAIRKATNGAVAKTKTLTQATKTGVVADAAGVVTLNNVDVFDLVSIQNTTDSADELEGSLFETGETDYFYDYGSVTGLTSGKTYDITYLYFAHTAGDYFSVDSYRNATNEALVNPSSEDSATIYGDFYGYIPSYVSTLGESYNLRDCLDFRRDISDLPAGTDLIVPNSGITADYWFYVPRVDKLYIDPYGNFGTVTGVSEINADHPKEPDDAMTIGTIYINPYTPFPENARIEQKETRRYTMEDIGEIEQRLENVEYYTAMNLLEKDAKELSITDKNGFDKFKNGILVDNFIGHDVGDAYHSEYRCSVDPEKELLRPSFLIDNLDFKSSTLSPSSNITEYDNIITMTPVSIVNLINQPYASEFINVNPYNVFIWEGSIKLTPALDNWVDTSRAPDLIVNQNDSNANWAAARNAARSFGTQWGWWRTNWVGTSRVGRWSSNRRIGSSASPWRVTSRTRSRAWWWGSTTTTSQRNIRTVFRRTTSTLTLTRRGQSRFGTRTVVRPKTTRKNLGDRVINTTIIPWIRSRAVVYRCTRMKPNTTVIAYFDGVNVSANCNVLTTNGNGEMVGTFNIPAGKFRTGTRILRFADDQIPDTETTSAEASYVASGLRQTKRRTILSITKPELVKERVSQSRVTRSLRWSSTSSVWASNRTQTRRRTTWIDPIAESFLVDSEGGAYLSDIEVYFKSKPTSGVPITLRIVENDNGYPSQVIIPYSEVTLNPSSVTASASAPGGSTKFTFADPVYLQDGIEYSFMLITNSDSYEVWIAKTGSNIVGTNRRIDKQPYTGVMFKSQNASTWTPDQERDIMFKINRYNYSTSVASVYNMDVDVSALSSNKEISTNMFNIENIDLDATNIDFQYRYNVDTDTGLYLFENKEDIDLDTFKTISTSGSDNQLTVVATMSTSNSRVTPLISIDSKSAVIVAIELSNDTSISPNNGQSYKTAATYITRTTNLTNPSDDLKILIDIAKPSTTDVVVYFKTGQYQPRNIDLDSGQALTEFDEQTVYLYYDDTLANVNTLTLKTNMIVSQVDTDNDKYFLKSIVDSSVIVPSNTISNTEIFVCLLDDITSLQTYDAAATYSVGEHIWFNNGSEIFLYECITNTSAGNSPTNSPTLWVLVPSSRVSDASVLNIDTLQEWRPMIAETTETEDDESFIETTFKPKELIYDEFSSFSIRIELLTNSEVVYPVCKSFRAIAVY